MDLDTGFVVIIAVLLLARIGFRRDVPMVAFFLACGGWALDLLWVSASRAVAYVLIFLRMVDYYERPPSIFDVVAGGVYTLTGFALMAAVLLAALRTPIDGPAPSAAAPPAAPPPIPVLPTPAAV